MGRTMIIPRRVDVVTDYIRCDMEEAIVVEW